MITYKEEACNFNRLLLGRKAACKLFLMQVKTSFKPLLIFIVSAESWVVNTTYLESLMILKKILSTEV